MIATLSGVVSEKLGDVLVLDVGGVGYGLIVTLADFGSLHAGQPAKLYVHEHIREDAHDLYGFAQQDTLGLFRQLLSVKNVGPKVALAVLGRYSLSYYMLHQPVMMGALMLVGWFMQP